MIGYVRDLLLRYIELCIVSLTVDAYLGYKIVLLVTVSIYARRYVPSLVVRC